MSSRDIVNQLKEDFNFHMILLKFCRYKVQFTITLIDHRKLGSIKQWFDEVRQTISYVDFSRATDALLSSYYRSSLKYLSLNLPGIPYDVVRTEMETCFLSRWKLLFSELVISCFSIPPFCISGSLALGPTSYWKKFFHRAVLQIVVVRLLFKPNLR